MDLDSVTFERIQWIELKSHSSRSCYAANCLDSTYFIYFHVANTGDFLHLAELEVICTHFSSSFRLNQWSKWISTQAEQLQHKLIFTTQMANYEEAGKQNLETGLQYLDFTSEVLEFIRISKMHTRIIAVDLHGSGSSLTLYLQRNGLKSTSLLN